MTIILALVILAFIPATIAQNGRVAGTARGQMSFGIWWLYGVLLLPIAIVNALPHTAESGGDRAARHRRRRAEEMSLLCGAR